MTDLTLTWDGERAPLAKAIVAAQRATESIKKAATNPAFKSKYADLSHVIEGVVPALNAAGVAVIQSPTFDGEMVSVQTMFLHESGSSVSSTLHLRPSKSDPQGLGSAITYGRRYALLAMSGAAPEDDDGNASSGPSARPEPKRTEAPAPTLQDRAQRLTAALEAAATIDHLRKAYTLAQGLRDELAKQDAPTLNDLDMLYASRFEELSEKEAA